MLPMCYYYATSYYLYVASRARPGTEVDDTKKNETRLIITTIFIIIMPFMAY